jgi:hypothetical protein
MDLSEIIVLEIGCPGINLDIRIFFPPPILHLGTLARNRWLFFLLNDLSLFYSNEHGRRLTGYIVEARQNPAVRRG